MNFESCVLRTTALMFPTCRMVCVTSLLALATLPRLTEAQSGGFVATLGTDTVHLERFTLEKGVYRGTIVTRVPETRVVRYTLTPGLDGAVLGYTVETFDGRGTPLRTNGAAGSLNFRNDTLIRVTLKDGVMDTVRISGARGAVPSPFIPYVGVTYLAYELAFAGLRATGDSVIRQLTMSPAQARPGATRAWLVGADSAELNYFGVARSGYKFDSNGRLLRADWRNTTYRYRIDRVAAPDVDTKVAEWANADQRGSGVGALSPRDTTRAAFDGASFTIDYSRPAKRGRNVWGDVVQPGQVWRLGADVATHFTSSRDIRLGDADIPAGAYTLWMVMAADGSAQLIVNKQTGIFGTQYKSANDLVRIALRRDRVAVAERLTLKLEGRELSIWWDDVAWRVPVSVK